MPSYCGLDFGTSNSTVATIGKDGPLLVPIEASYTAIPTVVFFRYDDNKTCMAKRQSANISAAPRDGRCDPSKPFSVLN